MPERARVTSLEAIESFRSTLVIYREKAGRVLDEVSDSVVRTRLWLQTNRIEHWKNELRVRERDLKQRQQELFSARMSTLSNSSFVQQAAVQKAQESLREAESKLQAVKQWNRQFDQRVEPLARQAEKFRQDLGHNLGAAIAWLNELTRTLAAYAEVSSSTTGTPATLEAQSGENTTESKKDGSQS